MTVGFAKKYNIDLRKLVKDQILLYDKKKGMYELNLNSNNISQYIGLFSEDYKHGQYCLRKKTYLLNDPILNTKIQNLIIAVYYFDKYKFSLSTGDKIMILSPMMKKLNKEYIEQVKKILEIKKTNIKRIKIELADNLNTISITHPSIIAIIKKYIVYEFKPNARQYFLSKNVEKKRISEDLKLYIKHLKRYIHKEFIEIRDSNLLISDILLINRIITPLAYFAFDQVDKSNDENEIIELRLARKNNDYGYWYDEWRQYCTSFVEHHSK